MSSKLSKSAEKALDNALCLAESFGHTYVGSDHLLLALAEDKDSLIAEMLARCDIDNEKIKNAILYYSGCADKTKLTTSHTTPMFRKHLTDAVKIAERYQDCSITTEHIFIAICEEKKSLAFKILRELGIDLRKIVLLRRKNK